jgi:hypothetical protein
LRWRPQLAPSAVIQTHPENAQGVAPGSPPTCPRMIFIMDTITKTTSSMQADTRMSAAPQALGETAENGTHATETFEKVSAATSEAGDLVRNSLSTTVKGAQE